MPGMPSDAQSLDEIDFAALYREHMRRHRLVPKPASAWDSRAADYARSQGARGDRSSYVDDFLGRLDLNGVNSVLDIGCGPGTLALPLAQRVAEVTALDYSPRMLEALQSQAAAAGLDNIRALHRAWEDDWDDVPVCDVAIASRSTTVDDLEAALHKMARHARLRAYLSYPADGFFVAREILDVLGAQHGAVPAVPDLLLVLGMLRRMGVHARLDYILTPSRMAHSTGFDDFVQRLAWSTGPLDEAAKNRLRSWYGANPERAHLGGAPMRWAFIGWDVAAH